MIHPFLLAIVPVLAIFVNNSAELSPSDLIVPLTVALLLALLIWAAAALLLGNRISAGLFTTLVLIPLYSGRQIPQITDRLLHYLSGFWVRVEVHVPERIFTLSVLLAICVTAFVVLARIKNPYRFNKWLNVCSIILSLLVVGQLVQTKVRVGPPPQRSATAFPLGSPPRSLPDIYYIILDGYARSDVLRELFDFDNGPFLDRLEQKGFYIARDSTSNYCQTPLSLSSSLNLQYLDDLVKGLGSSQTELHEPIGRNNLVATLRPLGYQFVTFATGFDPTDVTDSDRYLSPYLHFTELQRLLIDWTVLWAFLPETDSRDLFAQARDRTLYLLDELPRIASDRHPTFTFAHILCPHPPFIFGPNGEDISHRDDSYYLGDGNKFNGTATKPEIYVNGYRGQVTFITQRIEAVIDQLLALSKEPPIVILQSDHGSGLRLNMQSKEKTDLHERMSILNAYYFPNRDYRRLYQQITPVNSMRVVLNTFFDAHLDLLPDQSYYSTWSDPYVFMDVTSDVRAPLPQAPQQPNRDGCLSSD